MCEWSHRLEGRLYKSIQDFGYERRCRFAMCRQCHPSQHLNYLRYFYRTDAALKGRDTRGRKWQRKSKESSRNNLNEVLAKAPGAVRRSSCSGSAFRNCHGKDKIGCLSCSLAILFTSNYCPGDCLRSSSIMPVLWKRSALAQWSEKSLAAISSPAGRTRAAPLDGLCSRSWGPGARAGTKLWAAPRKEGTSLKGWSLWKSILN